MKRLKFLALVLAGAVAFASATYAFAAEDTGAVSATVTAKFISVTVEDGNVAYGLLDTGASQNAVALTDTQTVSVSGSNVPVAIAISSSDAVDPGGGTNWNLENTIGENQYKHEYSTNSGAAWANFPADNSLTGPIETLSGSETLGLDFQITAPSAVSDGNQKTITITVQGSG